jgi:4-amino-4-deoxy-L-arabinose transferase-like glycosyltransferase
MLGLRDLPRPVAWALLGLPFAVAVVALSLVHDQIHTFHYTDERVYHLPVVREFAREWPSPDLSDYPAAQTPLTYVLFAGAAELIGAEVWRLRLVNVAVSFASALVALQLFTLTLGRRWMATLAALALVLSPYLFGTSFLVMTDNLAFLFTLLCVYGCAQALRSGGAHHLALAGAAAGAALLTRQSAVWLFGLVALTIAFAPLDRRRTLVAAALLALAALPSALLFLSWDGLVPPSGDPSSCALCDTPENLAGYASRASRAPLFALANLGLYALILHGPGVLEGRRPGRGALAGAAIGAAALVLLPLHVQPRDEGLLWRAADATPELLETNALLWALVAAGGGFVGAVVARELPNRTLVLALVASFLASTVVIRLVYEKYFDPFVLLAVLLTLDRTRLRSRLRVAALAAICALSVAYAASDRPSTPAHLAHGAWPMR